MKTHYLAREPAIALPFLAMVANVLLVAGIAYATYLETSNPRLNVFSQVESEGVSRAIPILIVRQPGDIILQGHRISNPEDMKFKLSALAANGTAIVIHVAPGIDAHYLTRMLEMCNQSGFTDIALHTGMNPEAQRPPGVTKGL